MMMCQGKFSRNILSFSARKEDMATNVNQKTYDEVPVAEIWKVTGKGPSGSRWIHISKVDEDNPEYRSRLVSKEINRSSSAEMSAATPPLEAKQKLCSMAVTDFAQNRAIKSIGIQKLLLIDVRRACFYAPARRPECDTAR